MIVIKKVLNKNVADALLLSIYVLGNDYFVILSIYPSFSIKIPRDIIIFFVGGEDIFRDILSGYLAPFLKFHFFSPGYIIKEGVPISRGYFNGEIGYTNTMQ